MVIADRTEIDEEHAPDDVLDPLLWHDARLMMARHAEPDPHDGTCVWCGWRWPCAPRRLAERAELASRRPWQEAWTLRHDINSIRATPGLREDGTDRGRIPAPLGGRRRTAANRGRFR